MEEDGKQHRLANYVGEITGGRMEGAGTYWFDTNTRYEGEFKDGMFHGKGTLYFPDGGRYDASWENGREASGSYVFADELKFEADDDKLTGWRYCNKIWDRRFYKEMTDGLRPADHCMLSANCDATGKPCLKIPDDCYDTGDGYYDPKQHIVFRYNEDLEKEKLLGNNVIPFKRNVTDEEHNCIVTNCRKGCDDFVGCLRTFHYDDVIKMSKLSGRRAAKKTGNFKAKFGFEKPLSGAIVLQKNSTNLEESETTGRTRPTVSWSE